MRKTDPREQKRREEKRREKENHNNILQNPPTFSDILVHALTAHWETPFRRDCNHFNFTRSH